MCPNGMLRPFDPIFWNEPASVGHRRRSRSSLPSAHFCGTLTSVENSATISPSRYPPWPTGGSDRKRPSQCGTSTTQSLITSLRAFLRYLNFRGEFRDDLSLAIPAVAHWRLPEVPLLW